MARQGLRRRRSTKAAYAELYDNPSALFESVEVILFPNGYPELWIRTKDGRPGFRITAGEGPAGLRLTVSRLGLGGPGMTISGNSVDDLEVWPPKGEDRPELRELNVMVYNQDDWSQAFKRWVAGLGEHPGERP